VPEGGVTYTARGSTCLGGRGPGQWRGDGGRQAGGCWERDGHEGDDT
jgi:hypothetical protein